MENIGLTDLLLAKQKVEDDIDKILKDFSCKFSLDPKSFNIVVNRINLISKGEILEIPSISDDYKVNIEIMIK